VLITVLDTWGNGYQSPAAIVAKRASDPSVKTNVRTYPSVKTLYRCAVYVCGVCVCLIASRGTCC
jgi:hypothetical protein